MSNYKISEDFLLNESDVEQKVLMPLITNSYPEGLGFNYTHIQTKFNLKKLEIDKNSNSKLYYPDYLIIIDGLPLVVIEVKRPGEDLENAFREARLYCLEINSMHKKDLNPCSLIIATDGLRLLAGDWDNNQPIIDIDIDNWIISDKYFHKFIEEYSLIPCTKRAKILRESIRTKVQFKKPILSLGGRHVQNQQTKNNFGETISIQYRHIFNPEEESERIDIVENAYVKVSKHQSHLDPIDKLIRKKISPALIESTEILDNINPSEIIDKLKRAQNFNNQVLLLIGSVGSGKSTFITFLKNVGLDKALQNNLVWIRIDLNNAPVTSSEIYNWLKKQLINELISQNSSVDIDELETIYDIFHQEITAFNKGIGSLLQIGSDNYNLKLFDLITSLKNDPDNLLKTYIQYFVHSKGKELIVVLDNCDKRTLEEQLLMFEVASWLKENIKSIIFLPLRETTFDHHRNSKPLDTVVKDLIFRINPPPLEKVIYNRIKYAKRLNEKSELNFYVLPNGFKVSFPSTDELYYLGSILKSLFQNRFFKKLIAGLTGRDVRKGIEIFLDFCKSGHISDPMILQMKHAKGDWDLPNHIISRIFLRGSKVYYSDADAKIKNLFNSDPSDKFPDPFARISILKWLNDRNKEKGPSGILGFHQVKELLKSLNINGHGIERLKEELYILIKNSLIISESQDANNNDLDELVSISSSGIIHLELLNNIDYLSACSEDVWYNDMDVNTRILNRINGNSDYSHLSLQNNIDNSVSLINYMKNYEEQYYSIQKKFLNEDFLSETINYSEILKNISAFNETLNINSFKEIAVGTELFSKILHIKEYGLIVEIESSSIAGLVHISDIKDENFLENDTYSVGDIIKVKIKKYAPKHNKFNLEIVE